MLKGVRTRRTVKDQGWQAVGAMNMATPAELPRPEPVLWMAQTAPEVESISAEAVPVQAEVQPALSPDAVAAEVPVVAAVTAVQAVSARRDSSPGGWVTLNGPARPTATGAEPTPILSRAGGARSRGMGMPDRGSAQERKAAHHGGRSGAGRRFGAKAGVAGLATASLVAGMAGAAFANAANPTPSTSGSAIVNSNGTVTVTLTGNWTWPGQDCAGRYGEGYAVDWWGVSGSATPALPNGWDGKLTTSAVLTSTSTGLTTTATESPAGSIVYSPGGGAASTYFHVGQYYNGQAINGQNVTLNGVTQPWCTDSVPSGGNSDTSSGPWQATAVYPSVADVPSELCSIFYDPHIGTKAQNGNPATPSTNPKDYSTTGDTDNSIQTNAFNPAVGQGYCLQTAFLGMAKTGTTIGTYSGTGSYTLTATNLGGFPIASYNITDLLPPGEVFASSSPAGCSAAAYTGSPGYDSQVTCPETTSLAAGASNTVTINVTYGPGPYTSGLKDCATASTGGFTSNTACANTTFNPQTLTGEIYQCVNGAPTAALVTGGNITVPSGPQTVSASGNPISAANVAAGTYGLNATPPSGYQLVACGATAATIGSGGTSATEPVTVPSGGTGNGIFYAQPITNQTLSGHIYLCNPDGTQSTTEQPGGNISWSIGAGPLTVANNPFGPTPVQAATYDVTANAPSGFFLTACGSGHAPNQQSVTVPTNGSGNAVFYVFPNTNQTIAGHIYSCDGGTATSIEVSGGNLVAHITGQSTTPIQGANPLGPTAAAAATYTMDGTAPAGYKFVTCGTATTVNSDTSATQSVVVPAGGAGVGKFYVVSTATLAVTVVKTNNAADPTGSNFLPTEAAQNLGETFTYQAVITNPTSVDEIISVVTDTLPSTTGTPVNVCANLVGTKLPAHQSVTCTFSGQAPTSANVSLSDTVTVTVTNVPGNPPGTNTGTSTSTVTTTGQTLTGNIYLCAGGTTATTAQVPGGTIGAAGPTTVAPVSNPLTQVAVQAGSYTVTATAPTGYTFVATCPGAPAGTPAATPNGTSTSATEPVTVPTGGTGTGTFYVVPVTPGLGVSVIKANNAADPTGTDFSQTQTAQSLGETFTYQAIIANDNNVAEVISSISDLLPGAAASPECASLLGQTLQPGDSVTCTFSGTAPSTAGSSITDTVTVTTTNIPSNPPGSATGTGTSTVLTTPTVTITKGNNADGTGYGTSETATDTLTSVPYEVVVTNTNSSNGTITALTDTVNGTTMAICPDLIGDILTPGQSATCDFTGPVPTTPTTDTAAVTLSVNGILVTATAPSTVFPPVLAAAVTSNPPTTPTVATPATPTAVAPAQLAFTGAPVKALLDWALVLLLGGLALLGGLMVTDPRRRRLARVDGGWVTPSWAAGSAARSSWSTGEDSSATRPRGSASSGLLGRFQRSGSAAPARSGPQGASPQGPSAGWTAPEASSGDTRYRPDRA